MAEIDLLADFGGLKGALIALDLDNTLLEPDLTVSPRAKLALERCMAAGAIVTLATGRMFETAVRYAAGLGLTAPLVSYNGAVVRSPSGETVRSRHLDEGAVRRVLSFARGRGLYAQLYKDGKLYIERLCPEAEIDPDLVNGAIECGDYLAHPMPASPKMMLFTQPAENGRIIDELRALEPTLSISASQPYLVEVMPEGVTKAEALTLLGVERGRAICFGDSSNDIEMIKWAGLGVAVSNSRAELIEAADLVAGMPRGDGVAETLERLLLLDMEARA